MNGGSEENEGVMGNEVRRQFARFFWFPCTSCTLLGMLLSPLTARDPFFS